MNERLLEALQNLMGTVDTPIGRRLLRLSPEDEILQEARDAISDAKGTLRNDHQAL